jgi:hypothetical protein
MELQTRRTHSASLLAPFSLELLLPIDSSVNILPKGRAPSSRFEAVTESAIIVA